MDFNLANGQVKRATDKLRHRPFLEKIYQLFKGPQKSEEEIRSGLALLDDCKFTHEKLQNFTINDKVELLNAIQIEKRSAGQRIFPETAPSAFVLVLKGKIGIFHIDTHLRALQKSPGRVVTCSQQNLPRRSKHLLRKMHELQQQKAERDELERRRLAAIVKPLSKRERAVLEYKSKVSESLNMCDRFLAYSRKQQGQGGALALENPLFNI
jgi:ABC-type sulfate/molybdate transport systems ATPase subunit